MGNLNNHISKTWNREKFIKKQRISRKYRLLFRLKNNFLLYYLDIRDKYL